MQILVRPVRIVNTFYENQYAANKLSDLVTNLPDSPAEADDKAAYGAYMALTDAQSTYPFTKVDNPETNKKEIICGKWSNKKKIKARKEQQGPRQPLQKNRAVNDTAGVKILRQYSACANKNE